MAFPLKQKTLKYTITSSDITTSAQDLIIPVIDEFIVKDVIIKSDATGLAGGTNFVLSVDNAKGGLTLLETAVSGLGANATIDLANASVSGLQTVLESGKKITFANTVAVGTGAGTIDIYIVLEQVTSGAVATQ